MTHKVFLDVQPFPFKTSLDVSNWIIWNILPKSNRHPYLPWITLRSHGMAFMAHLKQDIPLVPVSSNELALIHSALPYHLNQLLFDNFISKNEWDDCVTLANRSRSIWIPEEDNIEIQVRKLENFEYIQLFNKFPITCDAIYLCQKGESIAALAMFGNLGNYDTGYDEYYYLLEIKGDVDDMIEYITDIADIPVDWGEYEQQAIDLDLANGSVIYHYMEPAEKYNFYKQLNVKRLKAERSGKRISIALEESGGELALISNMESTSDWEHLHVPFFNLYQYYPIYGDTIELDDYPTFLTPPMIENLLEYIDSKNGVYLPLMHEFSTNHYDRIPTRMKRYFHSPEARQLEKDRGYGREIAARIGIANPKWMKIFTKDEWIANRHRFHTSRVAVKTDERFLDMFATDNLENQVDDLLRNGPLIIEADMGSCANEVAYTFLVGPGIVKPLFKLLEDNRIMENDTGGRSGSVCSLHEPFDHSDERANQIFESMKRLADMDLGICGMIDVCMMEVDGQLLLCEWMVRTGCSNTYTELHQISTAWADIIVDLADAKDSAIQLYTKYSVGIDLHTVPLCGGLNFKGHAFSGEGNNMILNRVNKSIPFAVLATFDFVNTSNHLTPTGVYYDGNVAAWYGVVSTLSNDKNIAIDHAISIAKQFDIPNLAYKTTTLEKWKNS